MTLLRPPDARRRTVADAMLHIPKVHPPTTTVTEARRVFEDDHVHAVLIAADGRLLSVVDRTDLADAPGDDLARRHGRLQGRTVPPDASLEPVWQSMIEARTRRLAVIDEDGRLLGLLCLKRSGRGFCSDSDVQARAEERRTRPCAPGTTTVDAGT